VLLGALSALFSVEAFAKPTLRPAAEIKLEDYARIGQGDFERPVKIDIVDPDIFSPKSVRFAADGRKIYVNSLEGFKTVVYTWPGLKKIKTILHHFTKKDAALFRGEKTLFDYRYYSEPPEGTDVNEFTGKPVESELSHNGRWLWVPYYHRDWDRWSQSPSAIAIIDTQNDQIVRIMPTGPIPKYVVASPDDRYVAVVHWGDNTVGIIDTSSGDPSQFHYVSHLVVEHQLNQAALTGMNRDGACGFCLRGAVFSNNSEYLFVGRMGSGGIAGFHIPTGTYLGSVMQVPATPRHLVLSPDGETLYTSSGTSGFVSRVSLHDVIVALLDAHQERVAGPEWEKTFVGKGVRTLHLSWDGRFAFTAVNYSSEMVVLDTESSPMEVVARTKLDPYAVGLAVAPDTSAVVITSQGKKGHGGNAVNIIRVTLDEPVESHLAASR
jgi:DNA-binding beta-propeller fold protein YncE